jgi:hypothetical protein
MHICLYSEESPFNPLYSNFCDTQKQVVTLFFKIYTLYNIVSVLITIAMENARV